MIITLIFVLVVFFTLNYLTTRCIEARKIVLPEIYSQHASLITSNLISSISDRGELSYNKISELQKEFDSNDTLIMKRLGVPIEEGILKFKTVILLRPLIFPVLYRDIKLYIIAIQTVSDTTQFEEGVERFLSYTRLPYYISARIIYIRTFSSLAELVENPPSNIILINAHGDTIPVPSTYSPDTFITKIAENVANYGWIYVHTGGVPFYYAWVEGSGKQTLGYSGFSTFLSLLGVTPSQPTNVGSVQLTVYGERALWLSRSRRVPSTLVIQNAYSFTPSPEIYVDYGEVKSGKHTLFLLAYDTGGEFGFYLHSDGSSLSEVMRGELAMGLTLYSAIWYCGEIRNFKYGGRQEVSYISDVYYFFYKSGSIIDQNKTTSYTDMSHLIRVHNPDLIILVSKLRGLNVYGSYITLAEPSKYVLNSTFKHDLNLVKSLKEWGSGVALNLHVYGKYYTISSDVFSSNLDEVFSFVGSAIILNPTTYDYSIFPFLYLAIPHYEIDYYGDIVEELKLMTSKAYNYVLINIRGNTYLLEVVVGE